MFETTDPQGNKYRFTGTIHDFIPDQKIIRTFEFENMALGVQLEFLEFEKLTDDSSKLTMQIIYKSEKHRAEQLKLPFAYGINMAHDQLQEIVNKPNELLSTGSESFNLSIFEFTFTSERFVLAPGFINK